jgi:translocation and assembly module TamB
MSAGARPSRPEPASLTHSESGRPSAKRSLGVRFLRIVGLGFAALLGMVGLAVAGALVFLDTAPGRHFVAEKVNATLAGSFQGRIRIEHLGGLGLFGLSGADATLWDPAGHLVIGVHGAHVSLATLAAARSALSKTGALTVTLPDVTVDELEVVLDTDPAGQLELLDAFAPKTPSPPPDPHARGFRLVAPSLFLRHVWAHGAMAGGPPLDVDLKGLYGSLDFAPDLLVADVARLAIFARGIANGADVAGSVHAHVKMPTGPPSQLVAHVDWRGTAGTLAHSLQASLDQNHVDAVLDAPAISPDSVRMLWAGSALDRAGSAHAEVHGVLPALNVAFRAEVGDATFGAKGTLVVDNDKKFDVTLDARNIDVHQFARGAPQSRIGMTGEVTGAQSAAGAIEGTVAARFLGGSVEGGAVPPATIRAEGRGPNTAGIRASADVRIDEPSVPTHLTLKLTPNGKSSALTFALNSNIADLARVPELKHAAAGTARLMARGEVDLGTMVVDAHASAVVADVTLGSNRVDHASLDADVKGPAANLAIDATLQARGVLASGTALTQATVRAHGTTNAARITVSTRGPTTPDVEGSVEVGMGKALSLRGLRVNLTRGGERALVSADRVGVSPAIQVEGARIEGLGSPMMLALSSAGGDLRVKASTTGIDLGRVGRILHREKQIKAGQLSIDTDLSLARDRARGTLKLEVTRASFADLASFSSQIDLALDGRHFKGRIHADGGDVGILDLDAPKLDLGGGGPLAATSWREAWGLVDIDFRTDLARLALVIPADDLPFGESKGVVQGKGHIGRDNLADMTPDVSLALKTDGLVLAPNTPRSRDIDGVMVIGPPAWRLAGIDFDLDASIDGDKRLADLAVRARDTRGELAHIHAKLPRFPYEDVFHAIGRLPADLEASPFDVRFTVPVRGLGGLPEILKQSYVSGKAEADLHVVGPILTPLVDLSASLHDPHFSGENKSLSMNVDLKSHYDGKHAIASIEAVSSEKKLLDMHVDAAADVASFLGPERAAALWGASAKAHFADFPVSAISVIDDKLISGQLSGDFSLTDLHKDAHADLGLQIDGLRVGSTAYKSASLQFKADGHGLDGKMRIDQTDGSFEMTAHATAAWGTAIAPVLDAVQPVQCALRSKNFRIAALLPFLESTLDELDGRLDADTQVELRPNTTAKVSGTVSLSRGVIEAVAGGGEFHDVAALIKLNPDGTVTLDHLTAAGLTGKVQATASARLEGLTLLAAKAVIVIPHDAPIPLSGGGSEIGDIDGRVEVSASSASGGHALGIHVQVPNLRVRLPEGGSTTVQALGPIPNVRIGAHRGSKNTFLLVPIDEASKALPPPANPDSAANVTLDVNLPDVEVVRGKQLDVQLNGKVDVRGTPAEVTGQIQLKKGGTLEVQGKRFEIENGTVTLKGEDPSNPEIVVKASWTAPDATVVYANFIGPLKTGRVSLTSQPTLSQQEIVQLLLFGSVDGQRAQDPSATTENSAIATAGGEAAQPLNHALDQIGLGAVTAKVDTSDSANPKPEVEVQVARDISVQLAIVLGIPPPGTNPDSTLLTVDWRFLRKWSLASTLGDKGTTIFDVLWQKRY